MNHLFGISDHLIAAAERHDEFVDVVDTQSTAFEQLEDDGTLADRSVVERQHPVSAMSVERTQDADARVALVTVEPDWFVEM